MKRMKKFIGILLFVLTFELASTITIPQIGTCVDVQAANPFIQKNVSYYLYENQRPSGGFIIVYDPLPNGKISNIKNSNPNVVKVELDEQFGAIRVNVLKEGTSKVSFRYARKTFTQKITVVKYEDPCKSFKIGSTNYTKYFKKSRHFNHNNRKKDITATIKIVPKKGWKLTKIEVQNMYDGTKRVKNNSKVTLSIKGTGTGLYAYFKNTKTGVVQVLNLGYGSGNFPNRNYYD